ncbi:MAG: hypothetical protein AB7O59_03205 [Pirellulales bacterium]
MAIDDVTLEVAGLRVCFTWRDDRYTHALWADRGGEWTRLLESVEGDPSEPWPASPPWQSLHVEPRAGGSQVALLVGMAGKSHWSAGIELDPRVAQVRFEIACRAAEPRGPLGSRYQLATPVERATSTNVQFAAPRAPTEPNRAGPCLSVPTAEPEARLTVADGEIAIVPELPAQSVAVRTICWSYVFSR